MNKAIVYLVTINLNFTSQIPHYHNKPGIVIPFTSLSAFSLLLQTLDFKVVKLFDEVKSNKKQRQILNQSFLTIEAALLTMY